MKLISFLHLSIPRSDQLNNSTKLIYVHMYVHPNGANIKRRVLPALYAKKCPPFSVHNKFEFYPDVKKK